MIKVLLPPSTAAGLLLLLLCCYCYCYCAQKLHRDSDDAASDDDDEEEDHHVPSGRYASTPGLQSWDHKGCRLNTRNCAEARRKHIWCFLQGSLKTIADTTSNRKSSDSEAPGRSYPQFMPCSYGTAFPYEFWTHASGLR